MLKSPYFPGASLGLPKGGSLKSAKKEWAVDVDTLEAVFASQGNAQRYFTHAQSLIGKKAAITDGTIEIGQSVGQATLYLLVRGPRAGDVWVDALGNDVFDVFGPASTTPELLTFLHKSLARVEEAWSHLLSTD